MRRSQTTLDAGSPCVNASTACPLATGVRAWHSQVRPNPFAAIAARRSSKTRCSLRRSEIRSHDASYIRPAFTLLELLLAAGITTFVLATLMTAITFVARTEGSSADRVELTRLGTALLQLLERDLGAIVIVAEVTEESTRQVEADEAVDAEAVDDLVVFLGASDRIDLVSEGALTDTKRLLEMAAWSDTGEEWDGGFGPKRRLISWGALTSEFGDELALRQSSVFSSDGLSASVVYENTVPELSEIQFRYLSDGEWVDAWNSVDNGGLPAAVEVSLALQTVTEGSELSGIPITWQRIITVPQGRYAAATSSTDAAEGEL